MYLILFLAPNTETLTEREKYVICHRPGVSQPPVAMPLRAKTLFSRRFTDNEVQRDDE